MKKGRTPDPVSIAFAAEMAGIDGLLVHLREDRSDITDRDVGLLKEVVQTHLNLAIPMNDDMIKKALSWLPDMVTLLPSSAGEPAEASLDVANTMSYLEEAVTTLRANNIVVTMLVDPEPQQIRAAARVQADYIQINTSVLSKVDDLGTMTDVVEQIRSAAIAANKIGLGVSAGRSLSGQSLRELADIKYIEEFNVGWAICSRSILVGVEKAVTDMKKVLES